MKQIMFLGKFRIRTLREMISGCKIGVKADQNDKQKQVDDKPGRIIAARVVFDLPDFDRSSHAVPDLMFKSVAFDIAVFFML